MKKLFLCLVFALVMMIPGGLFGSSENHLLAELKFEPRRDADRTAGVWVDGQYVGYVKELTGDKKLLLMPGKHELLVRQAWYKDYELQTVLEPGQTYVIKLALTKDAQPASAAATAELKISASPTRAAVFVDDQFAGHVDEFDGAGKAMLLVPGQHRIRLALPGYLPFQTEVDLRPHQKLKIQTELEKGSITEAGSLVSAKAQ
jgi:hypothetical protein